MQLQCPCCDAIFNLEEGFTSTEGKQLAALFAGLEPTLGKAILYYLRLFTPSKKGLKTTKAIKIVEELISLVRLGTVTRDARTNDVKPATIKMWVAGIEQMLDQRDKLSLPLNNHNYLRTIVWSIANDPSTVITTIKPIKKTNGRAEINELFSKIIGDLKLGLIDQATADERIAALKGQ